MADIIRLRDIVARVKKRPPPVARDALILLFTGVRYERRDQAEKPIAGLPALTVSTI